MYAIKLYIKLHTYYCTTTAAVHIRIWHGLKYDLQLLTSSGANSAREPRTNRRESLLLSTRACSLSTVCMVAFLKKAK